MRIKMDECLDARLVGHEVRAIREQGLTGISDEEL